MPLWTTKQEDPLPADRNRKLLVVEDDPGLQSQLRWCFDDYEVILAEDRESAISALRRHEPPVITLDLGLPPDPSNASEGLATLARILELAPTSKVIVVTGNDDRENALKAIELGAYDFYHKPVDAAVLGLIVDRAWQLWSLEEELRHNSLQGASSVLEGVIGVSPQMMRLARMVERVGPANVSTLLLGESGTGKELIARALHRLSGRRGRFVAINCGAIPENLLESELFGYEKGAFTGAVKQTKGRIEFADGGTLFLDEIGDMPMALQVKLLRFLQERVIERLGGREEIPVDVRVICATHRDLQEYIREGVFREDLYYRIGEVSISIPPLREREGDATVIARVLLDRFAREQGCSGLVLSAEAIEAIDAHDWPGNVRELENRIKRAVIMAEGGQVTAEDLELTVQGGQRFPFNLREVREQAERSAVVRAVAMADGNLSQAAKLLGITRPTLYSLMDKFHLRNQDKSPGKVG
ncbi:MAG TPA: PEP-CTERM-box response regulator transcription factor [Chloroflexi bacterium]|nr:PEP-CTERM-box response regulator transcription factor [Chloroflexota bacterium]